MVAVASTTVLYGQSESATRWSLASIGLGFVILATHSSVLGSIHHSGDKESNDDFENIYLQAKYSLQYIYSDSTRLLFL